MSRADLTEPDYLREMERLAGPVIDAARAEGWLSYEPDPDGASPLQRAVNQLARTRRSYHFTGDGCCEDDRPLMRLAGVRIVRPDQEDYEQECDRFGVGSRPEGWALWCTWGDEGNVRVTLVVTAVDTTEGLLANWSTGRPIMPARPLPSQIALVHEGWLRGMIFSPAGVRRLGELGT